jgi:hypothetical protein
LPNDAYSCCLLMCLCVDRRAHIFGGAIDCRVPPLPYRLGLCDESSPAAQVLLVSRSAQSSPIEPEAVDDRGPHVRRYPEPGRHGGWPQRKCGQCLRQDRSCPARIAGWPCRPDAGPCSPHLEAAVTCGSSGPRTPRPAAPHELPCPRWPLHGPPRIRVGGWYPVVGRTLPSGSAGHRRHQPGDGHQPGHVCRTLSVRTAVVPEAADGSIAGGYESLWRR